jgi:spore germination protein GerM
VRRTIILLAAALLLTACAAGPGETDGGYLLYFLSQEDAGAALTAVEYTGAEQPDARQLLTALIAGPDEAELSGPIPQSVSVRSCRLEEGVLYVDLSEEYGGLTGIKLTLADYAITLTLCQLDGVDGVCITAAGEALSYRSHQILTPEEVILTGVPQQEGA